MNPEEQKTEYLEINTVDYIKTICKRIRLIIGLFLIAVIGAGVYSFFVAPKIYRIETSLEIGTVGSRTADGSSQIIEEPVQVTKKIENDVYGVLVRRNLKILEGGSPGIKAENPENTNLVIMEIKYSQPDLAVKILKEVNNLILADHQEKIKIKKESLGDDIFLIENNIEVLKRDIKRIEAKIESLKEEKRNLEAKVVAIQKVLPYQQDPGTQFALFDAKERLERKKQEVENLYMKINALEGGGLKIEGEGTKGISINAFQQQINLLRRQIDDIRLTRIIKDPAASKSPIKPRPVLNMVLAGTLGIFIAVFLAFGKEWWDKNRKNF